MFRVTDRQTTFGSLGVVLTPEKVARLEKGHWAGTFRSKAWPVLLESERQFAALFCANNGRPNKSVAQQLGVLILKEMFDLTWEQTLEAVEFNLAWQYALDMELKEAHACQKTLHNFCHRMDEAAAGGEVVYAKLFDEIVSRIVSDLGLNVSRQRLDSTHIRSNMKILSRLGLFVHTITCFLKDLRKCHGGMYASLPAGIRKRYVDREGYFADSPSSEGRRRLEQSAADLWRLVNRFRGHKSVSKMKTYQRLARLLEEQCVVEDGPPTDPDGDGPDGVPVRAKDPQTEKIPGTSLQGSDDDATYGHKGKGYQVQVAETCVAENPVQVVTHLELEGAHESDQHAPIETIEALAEKDCKPEALLADTGYSSGENIVSAAAQGVTLVSPSSGSAPQREGSKLILDDFVFSADGQRLEQCPEGQTPIEQGESGTEGRRRYARMAPEVCANCSELNGCPWRWNEKQETVTVTWSPPQAAMAQRRREEEGKTFKDTYRVRSGIEATNSEYKRRYGGGRLRVRGRPRVQRVVYFKFTALNIRRWLRAVCRSAEKSALQPAEKAA